MPARLKIQLTESEEQELLELSCNPKIPERTRKRAEILRLNAFLMEGKRNCQLGKFFGKHN